MPFFHATITSYTSIPHHLTSPSLASVGPNAVAALEKERSLLAPCAPSRAACYFGCENPENAVRYLEAERSQRKLPPVPILVYEVDFPSGYHSGAMALIGAIEKRLGASGSADRMISEYWAPALKWQFLEVFGPEMRILATVARPDFISLAAATLRYRCDHAQAAVL